MTDSDLIERLQALEPAEREEMALMLATIDPPRPRMPQAARQPIARGGGVAAHINSAGGISVTIQGKRVNLKWASPECQEEIGRFLEQSGKRNWACQQAAKARLAAEKHDG